MNRNLLIAAALMSATAAFAQEATPDTWMNATLTKSTAEVRAELAQARQSGTIAAWTRGYIEPLRSELSRAEVRADVLEARESGELATIDAEAYAAAPVPAPATRVAANGR